jgi:hypothetical protein
MKKFQIIIFLFFFLIFGSFLLTTQKAKDNITSVELYHSYEPYKIFNELYYLVSTNKSANKMVYKAIEYIKKKIDNKELMLLVDHKNDSKDILTGAFFVASFYKPEINKPYILFNKNLIDIYYYQKSIVFSMFIHEIKHAYDYYTNFGLFEVTDKNLLERYMFQMDALYIEALLIEKFLKPNNFSLTDFEEKLLESFQKNNLSDYSFIFEAVDMKLTYYMYKVMENKDHYEKNFKQIIDVGNNVVNEFNKIENFSKTMDENDEWMKYKILISAYTFAKFVNQITYNIINIKHKNMNPEEFNLNDYSPELFELNKNISDMVFPYIDRIHEFQNNNFNEIDKIYDNFLDEFINFEYFVLNKDLYFLHIIPNDILKINDAILNYQYLGSAEEMPDVLSKKYNMLINKSIKLYNNKNYEQAAKVLEIVVKNEPNNPFVLNYYARALYWFDNNNSYKYYKKLIEILDNQDTGNKYLKIKNDKKNLSKIENEKLKKEIKEVSNDIAKIGNNKIIIDYWFMEAYWKLGTLYLDRGDFLRGVYEITRSMSTSMDYKLLREQAYNYLCESYCFLKKPELANYCAEKVFKINPDNKYILKFLDMLNE